LLLITAHSLPIAVAPASHCDLVIVSLLPHCLKQDAQDLRICMIGLGIWFTVSGLGYFSDLRLNFCVIADFQLVIFFLVSGFYRFFPVWQGTGNWTEPEFIESRNYCLKQDAQDSRISRIALERSLCRHFASQI